MRTSWTVLGLKRSVWIQEMIRQVKSAGLGDWLDAG